MQYSKTQESVLAVLKEDKEKRGGFSHFPKLELKRRTGITDEELYSLLKNGNIERRPSKNDTVITFIHD